MSFSVLNPGPDDERTRLPKMRADITVTQQKPLYTKGCIYTRLKSKRRTNEEARTSGVGFFLDKTGNMGFLGIGTSGWGCGGGRV